MPQTAETAVVIRAPRGSAILPDNRQYTNRFEIRSESSDRVYIVAQNINGRWWSCSCMGWISRRKCKHLEAIGLPANKVPYEAQLAAAS